MVILSYKYLTHGLNFTLLVTHHLLQIHQGVQAVLSRELHKQYILGEINQRHIRFVRNTRTLGSERRAAYLGMALRSMAVVT